MTVRSAPDVGTGRDFSWEARPGYQGSGQRGKRWGCPHCFQESDAGRPHAFIHSFTEWTGGPEALRGGGRRP